MRGECRHLVMTMGQEVKSFPVGLVLLIVPVLPVLIVFLVALSSCPSRRTLPSLRPHDPPHFRPPNL